MEKQKSYLGENKIKKIASAIWKFGRLILDSGDREETSIVGTIHFNMLLN